MASTASEIASASHLATCALRRGQQHHHGRADHRNRPQHRQPRERGHHSCTARIARDDQGRAGQHRQRVGPGEPGLQLPQAVRDPADQRPPARSPRRRPPRRRSRPGPCVSSLSRPHEHLLVERVAVEILAGRHGQRRPGGHLLGHRLGCRTCGRRSRCRRRPPTAGSPWSPPTPGSTWWASCAPTTGSSQCSQRAADRQRATGGHRADREQDHRPGHHRRRLVRMRIVRAQRFSPKNVISITRVM